jgi:hypothetical protein
MGDITTTELLADVKQHLRTEKLSFRLNYLTHPSTYTYKTLTTK